jgi:protein SCO1/2
MKLGRRALPCGLGATLAALMVCCSVLALATAPRASADIPAFDRVRVLPAAREIGDAELTNQDGAPFRLSELRGRVVLVLFGFTNCPDACPLGMQRMRELHHSDALDLQDVAYVMISVDGERDTPAAMKAFLEKYSSDFIGLTGAPALVQPIAARFAAAFFKGHSDHAGHYDVAHSPQIFVLDTNGRLRAELYTASVEAMIGVANALIDERP